MGSKSTIFALSSGPGVSGVAVIRVSGPACRSVLKSMAGASVEPRKAKVLKIRHPKTKEVIDIGLVLWFPAPASFTGEDVIEFHVHGGRAVVAAMLDALQGESDLRIAEAGEFTRRAFDNGKMDLTEAEGLSDLIHAQTEEQRNQALKQMDGSLRDLYEGWRARLVAHLAHLEADIDFPDENLPEGIAGAVRPEIMTIYQEIKTHLESEKRGRAIRNGFRIVILGAPNAGKSTLFNALSCSEAAIVSDEAGTTRDSIEMQFDLGGFPVRLIDTAGLREGGGEIEQEGMRRAIRHAEDAELRLVLIPADQKIDEKTKALITADTLVVLTKCDLSGKEKQRKNAFGQIATLETAAKQGAGVQELLDWIGRYVAEQMGSRESVTLTRLRHKSALISVVDNLMRFDKNAGVDAVLAAEDVRLAARALGSITGLVQVEEILDVVFSDFCIGK